MASSKENDDNIRLPFANKGRCTPVPQKELKQRYLSQQIILVGLRQEAS